MALFTVFDVPARLPCGRNVGAAVGVGKKKESFMAGTGSTLSPTVEQLLSEAVEGPPKPLLECSAEEAVEVCGAEPNSEMEVTDIDGWEGGEDG